MPRNTDRAELKLCISIVTYEINPEQLSAMLTSLQAALIAASQNLPLKYTVVIVDNGQEAELLNKLTISFTAVLNLSIISNKQNLGYGAAHNQAIKNNSSDYHLLMNPDVVVQPDCLLRAIQYLEKEQDVMAIIPEVRDLQGKNQYLCKHYPSVTDLALRGFAPRFIKKFFDRRLALYECRNMVDKKLVHQVEMISGCFMFCRASALRALGGFNEEFFLYFEDFALSIELNKLGKVVYFPQVSIVHYGGHAARKGWQHIKYFSQSAYTFFKLYGWKLY